MSASPAHRVHGLTGDEVPPDWPPLTLDELEPLFARYPELSAPQAIGWHSPRPLAAAARVETAAGPVFAKRHHASVRSAATLAEEHAFAAHLRANAIPVPPIHADADGRTAVALGDWTWELHAPAAGQDLYRDAPSWTPLDDLAHARAAGAMLARLHAAAQGFEVAQRGTHLLVARAELIEAGDAIAALRAQLPERPALARWLDGRRWDADLGEAIAPLHARVQARAAAQPRLWTHGDWHASNLFWSRADANAGVSAVVDFGLCARTFALFDLATAIERNAIAWLEPDDDRGQAAIARALIAGYREVSALKADDIAFLADLLPVVHLDFALSEVEYYAGITRSQANAEAAWGDFLLGHARWFSRAPGRAFLHALRAA